MRVAVLVSDASGEHIEFNEALAEFHRSPQKGKCSESLTEHLAGLEVFSSSGKLVSSAEWIVSRALRGETGIDEEYSLRRKDSGETWIGSYRFGPIRNARGAIIGSVVSAEDVTARKQAEEQLRNTSSRLHLALSSAHLGVWDWDVSSNSMTWDDRMLELYGVTRKDFPNTVSGWEGPLHPDDRQRAVEEVKAALAGERDFDTEFRVVHPNGKVLHLKANGLVLRAPDGSPKRMLGVNADITELKTAEQDLRRAYAEVEAKVDERTAELEAAKRAAEDANQAKDLFLATLSHELRTPLSAILSWSQLIERGLLPPDKAQMAIRTIKENAWAQSQLISDLLDVSRIVTGKLQIDMNPILVQEVVSAATEAIRLSAEQRGLAIEETCDNGDLYVLADAARLKQAILNLLSNAVKFTPCGGKIIVATKCIDSVDGKFAQVSVRDTGKGIPAEFLPNIFSRFSQADPSSIRVYGGLGLGLSLVRSLIELQGGRVAAESPGEGKGATFTISIPLLETASHRPAVEIPPSGYVRSDCLKDLKILFVEDSVETREAISHLLRSYGAEVVEAPSASAALHELERFAPDAIVSDIAMPQESGHSLMRKIRARGDTRGGATPAIALTAYAEARDRDEAFQSGFQEYLTKPVDAESLISTVLRVASRAQGKQAPVENAIPRLAS